MQETKAKTISLCEANRKYGVPRATIQDRIHGRVAEDHPRKMGPNTVLTSSAESLMVTWCTDLAKCGFPLKRADLLNTVQQIINDQRDTPFINGRPGRKWYDSFLRRLPNLVHREAEGITKGRAIVTEQSIRKWFSDLKAFFVEQNATDLLEEPSRILNGDETSFSMCPKTGKVLAPKGYKNVYSVQRGNERRQSPFC